MELQVSLSGAPTFPLLYAASPWTLLSSTIAGVIHKCEVIEFYMSQTLDF